MIPNPWLILAAVVALGASHVGAYVYGGRAKENAILAEQKRQDALTQAFARVVAENIAAIKITNTTIYQRATREVIKEPVYVDARHTPDGLRLVNGALAGAVPAAAGELPRADAVAGR